MISLRRSRRRGPRRVVIRIRGGVQHERHTAACGRPLRVAFRREDPGRGPQLIVFPKLGRGLTLASGQEVELDLPAERPVVHEFESNGGLRGSIEIRAAAKEA